MSVTVFVTQARSSLPGGSPWVELSRFFVRSVKFSRVIFPQSSVIKFQSFREQPSLQLISSLRLSRLAIAVFCDQHYPKARLPSHHLRVGLRRLVEWDGLDHGGHAAQRTETERSVSGRRVPCQRAFELAAPEYEIHT